MCSTAIESSLNAQHLFLRAVMFVNEMKSIYLTSA